MFSRLRKLEITCDAPPYAVVHACRAIGIERPEDVRWCRLDREHRRPRPPRDLFHLMSWRALLGRRRPAPDGDHCTCGQKLPTLREFSFSLSSGSSTNYQLGQCARCRTVFWEWSPCQVPIC